jgi:hypothetical protein
MNDELHKDATSTPDFSGEEMKLPENSTPPAQPEKSVVSAPILLLLGVLLIGLLAGLYLWFNSLNNAPEPVPAQIIERPTPEENNEPESTTAEAQTDNLEVMSTSDEISAIEADIEATDLESLDAELEAIEAELNATI